MPDLPSENPYQSPALLADEEAIVAEMAVKDRLLLRKCQQQMVGLGLIWMGLGIVGLGLAAFIMLDASTQALAATFYAMIGLVILSSLLQFLAGVLTCFKQLSAVYLGLVISYPTALVHVLVLNLCPFLLIGISLLLAHRVLRWAKELKARGIPLTASAELPP